MLRSVSRRPSAFALEEIALPAPLLSRVAKGDTAAIDECLDRYGGLVWSLARRLSPTTADAEDAVQEIFIDLWRSAGRYSETLGEEVTFVSTLARRRLIDRLRSLRRTPDPVPIDGSALVYAAPMTAVDETSEEATRAAECLGKLRENAREVLELSIYHGLAGTTIAQRTGLPLGTVKTLIRRGLTQLRSCMQAVRRVSAEGGVSL